MSIWTSIVAPAGMYTPGIPEMAIFFAIVLIFFGPKRLPQLSRSIGRSITDFKKGLREVKNDIEEADDEEDGYESPREEPVRTTAPPPQAPPPEAAPKDAKEA